MNYKEVETQVAALDKGRLLDYENYFKTIYPKNLDDIFRRWIFAYASVHTTWKFNVELYKQLQDLSWLGNIHVLRDRIKASKAGLHNNRAAFIMSFANFYWAHPFWFNKMPNEDWFQYRNRIMEKAPGIGRAKAESTFHPAF